MTNDERIEKIRLAIEIDQRMKKDKKELDRIKAEIQADAVDEMDNKNLKHVEYFSPDGSCRCGYAEKIEVDNLPRLKEIVGDVIEGKVTVEYVTKISLDEKFKKALLAIYKGEYKEHDIPKMLSAIGLDDKQIKVAMKKLKGEYFKDRDLLHSLGAKGSLEEEIDAIREHKNFELIDRYFDLKKIDIAGLKRCMTVIDSLSIGLVHGE